MSMITQALTVGTWYQFTNLDDERRVQLYLDSTDEVIAAIEAGTPDSSSPGFFCSEGINVFDIPDGKSCWVKLTSGAADVIYSQFDGVLIDLEKCAYARTDTISIGEAITNASPIAGFDDSVANQLSYVGLLHTAAVGVSSTATIGSAVMTITFAQFRTGRQIRIKGIESATSITSGLTDYASLASGPTLTTAVVDITLDGSGSAQVDLSAILQELLDDVGSWSTSSPLQLWLGDISSSPTSGIDETAVVFVAGRGSALFVRSS